MSEQTEFLEKVLKEIEAKSVTELVDIMMENRPPEDRERLTEIVKENHPNLPIK